GQLRVRHDQVDCRDRQAQLFRHHLTQRCANILPDFHLAGVYGYLPILADVQPRAEFLWTAAAEAAAAALLRGFLCNCIAENQANEHSTADNLKEVTPIKTGLVPRLIEKLVALRFNRRLADCVS